MHCHSLCSALGEVERGSCKETSFSSLILGQGVCCPYLSISWYLWSPRRLFTSRSLPNCSALQPCPNKSLPTKDCRKLLRIFLTFVLVSHLQWGAACRRRKLSSLNQRRKGQNVLQKSYRLKVLSCSNIWISVCCMNVQYTQNNNTAECWLVLETFNILFPPFVSTCTLKSFCPPILVSVPSSMQSSAWCGPLCFHPLLLQVTSDY